MSHGQGEDSGSEGLRRSVRRVLRTVAAAVVILLVAAQLLPVDRNNPPVEQAKTMFVTEHAPADVATVLQRSCADCHSNETRWPWYSYIAPASWMVAHDVHEARRKMNFSEWGNYSSKKKDHELEEICNELMEGDMPDRKYLFVHRSARVADSERETICTWTGSPHQ